MITESADPGLSAIGSWRYALPEFHEVYGRADPGPDLLADVGGWPDPALNLKLEYKLRISLAILFLHWVVAPGGSPVHYNTTDNKPRSAKALQGLKEDVGY